MFAVMVFVDMMGSSLNEEGSWLNYPGFELWRFVNLLIFVVALLYVHRRFGKPVREGLRARRHRIKVELEDARKEREEALAKQTEVETRLKELDAQVASIWAQAKAQSIAESERIRRSTELDVLKLTEQGQREIANVVKIAQLELRRFAAGQSIRFAEILIRRDIRAEDDARLISMTIKQLGGGRA